MWGNYTTEESNQAIKTTTKAFWVIEHMEKQFQKNSVPRKSLQ
jgi:hypothetical protein